MTTEETLDYTEQELDAVLQNRLGLSTMTAIGIREAIYNYVEAIIAAKRAEQQSQ